MVLDPTIPELSLAVAFTVTAPVFIAVSTPLVSIVAISGRSTLQSTPFLATAGNIFATICIVLPGPSSTETSPVLFTVIEEIKGLDE